MIVAIISIILIVLDVLTVTPYSPLPPGFLSIGSVFLNPHLFDHPIIIGAPIITVPGLPGLRSGSVDPNSFLFGILPIPTVESYTPPFEHTTPVDDPYVDFFAYQPSTFAGLWADLQTLTRIDPVHLILERGVVLSDSSPIGMGSGSSRGEVEWEVPLSPATDDLDRNTMLSPQLQHLERREGRVGKTRTAKTA
ncbi:hypothetical protein C8Q73DRAFT_840177 [Cubamyces lactineus]|nr:hypothetical protein C8Q73DRAFT_840177 [Cubamyces lactineus]